MRARVSVRAVRSSFLKLGQPAAIVAALLGIWLSAAGRAQADPASGAKPASGPAITQKEADEFGRALEAAVAAGEIARANAMIDWGEIVDRATRIPDRPELNAIRESYKKEILRTAGTGAFVVTLHNAVKSGGSYSFQRSELNGKEPFVQFRLELPNQDGINYHRYYLVRRPDGSTIVADLFVLTTGERMSETFSNTWRPLAANTLGTNAKSNNAPSTYEADLAVNVKLLELSKQQKFQEMLQVYKNAPESSRRDKVNLTLCLRASQKVSDEEYSAIIAAFQKFHPDNPSLNFFLIDGYLLKEKYDEAVACVDRTMQQIGVDAALLTTRASIRLRQNKFPEAMADMRKAIAAEPDSFKPYSDALDVARVTANHAATLEFLTALEKKFGLEYIDLASSERFAMFVKSPQFKTWQAAHGVK